MMIRAELWDGARSLYEMLEIEESVKPFVNDFKLNLFDYHEWNDFSRFKTENRLLFEALSCGSSAKRMKEVLQKNPGFGRLDLESAKAIAGILKVKVDLELIKAEDEEGEKVYDMCKAFDDYKEEGRREGELEMALLITKLFGEGRTSDAELAAKDGEARKRFYKEFGMID